MPRIAMGVLGTLAYGIHRLPPLPLLEAPGHGSDPSCRTTRGIPPEPQPWLPAGSGGGAYVLSPQWGGAMG
jgi:hypothetical protein